MNKTQYEQKKNELLRIRDVSISQIERQNITDEDKDNKIKKVLDNYNNNLRTLTNDFMTNRNDNIPEQNNITRRSATPSESLEGIKGGTAPVEFVDPIDDIEEFINVNNDRVIKNIIKNKFNEVVDFIGELKERFTELLIDINKEYTDYKSRVRRWI